MKSQALTNQDGRSMLEMMGVLAIMLIMFVAGISGFSKAMQTYKTSQAIEAIHSLKKETQDVFASQATYEALNNNALDVKENIMNSLDNASVFGGLNISAATRTGGLTDGAFLITLSDVPSAVCLKLSIEDWGSPRTGFIELKISNTLPVVTAESSIIESATALCVADDLVDMSWLFQ